MCLTTLVDQLNYGALAERHGRVTIERTTLIELVVSVCRRREQQRLEAIDDAVPKAEEVPQGHEDAGFLRVVPGNLQ